MNKALKFGLISGAAIGIVWLGGKAIAGLQLARTMSFRITDFGIPRIAGNVLSVPLKLQISNPTDASINVDSVAVALWLWKQNQFVRVGSANLTNVPTLPGVSEKTFTAQVDLKQLSEKLFDTLAEILSANSITLLAEAEIVAEGIPLPVQSFTKTLSFA